MNFTLPAPIKVSRFRPRLLDAVAGYDRSRFLADAGAGVTVGIVALPLAMAFAIASGVKPEQGIFTAIIGGFLISALGGSHVQIGGPAGAFIVIVDSSGLDALQQLHRNLRRQDVRLLLCALNAQPMALVRQAEFDAVLGPENLHPDVTSALAALTAETTAPEAVDA